MKILISFLLLNLGRIVLAFNIIPIEPTKNRTNYCNRARAVLNNSIPLLYGLKGMKVLTAIHELTPNFYMNVSGNTGQPLGGFMYNIQTQIAIRGGFKFQYVLVPKIPDGISWTTRLVQILPHADIYGNTWYADTTSRRAAGLGFVQSVVDASLVLVTTQDIVTPAFNPWSFLIPFTNELWACAFGVTFLNGFLHWLVDDAQHRDKPLTLFRAMYLSFGTYAGADGMGAEKPMAAVISLGYSFFLMILLSTYTANLASTLVAAQVPTVPVQSIDDANRRGLPICALAGSTALSVLQSSFPKVQAVVAPTNSVAKLFDMIRSGACVGAVVGVSDWEVAQVQAEANPKCNLVTVGENIRIIPGAWPFKQDYSSFCTSFIETVLSDIIVGMKADGSLQTYWASAIAAATTIQCSTESASSSVQQMQVSNLAGVFIVYAMTILVLILMGVWKYLRQYLKDRGQLPKWMDKAENPPNKYEAGNVKKYQDGSAGDVDNADVFSYDSAYGRQPEIQGIKKGGSKRHGRTGHRHTPSYDKVLISDL